MESVPKISVIYITLLFVLMDDKTICYTRIWFHRKNGSLKDQKIQSDFNLMVNLVIQNKAFI